MIKKNNDLYSSYVLDKNNIEELREVQKLRYQFLNREYNPNLPEDGIDDDGYDEISDILVIKDKSKNKIVGTYRVTSPITNKEGKPYLIERQFNIDSIKNSGELFGQLSRACVHKDYRNGLVIRKLFVLIYEYFTKNKIRYSVGTVSFHGVDENKYKNAFTYLYRNYSFEQFEIKSVMNPFNLNMLNDDVKIDKIKSKEEMPGLLQMYLLFSSKIYKVGSIDKNFNDIDVFSFIDFNVIDQRILRFFIK